MRSFNTQQTGKIEGDWPRQLLARERINGNVHTLPTGVQIGAKTFKKSAFLFFNVCTTRGTTPGYVPERNSFPCTLGDMCKNVHSSSS